MNEELKKDILAELKSLEKLSKEMTDLVAGLTKIPTTIQVRAAASILHDFYSGVEKVLKRIILANGENLPEGRSWHRELLRIVSEPAPGRTEILDEEQCDALKEFLAFRHLFRNAYGFGLDWETMEDLCDRMPEQVQGFAKHINEFING